MSSKLYRVMVDEIRTCFYEVRANTPEEAAVKVRDGSWDNEHPEQTHEEGWGYAGSPFCVDELDEEWSLVQCFEIPLEVER